MKFLDLIKNNNWLRVKMTLLNLYPNEEKSISGYEDVYEKLFYLSPVSNDLTIQVKNEIDDFDKEEYVDVSGYYKNPKTEEEKFSQAIEFTAWNKWLGMDIDKNSLLNFSELEIIAHCIYEMTFMGFEEEGIQEELNNLEDSVDEYK
ncbi:MAG: hypothetical protein L3J20_13895, partial [Flavobacteriaceae bacterium]|nr:hypothetical protein [Flavobacteriaceae bacterium]